MATSFSALFLILFMLPILGCGQNSESEINRKTTVMKVESPKNAETAIFGAGCFWCVEAVFERLEGVLDVESGYAGGSKANPTYEEVCSGKTGHAEVCKITFDPSVITYDALLEVFWKTHDPTTLNRQGNDVGTQYRSVIFTLSDSQQTTAEYYKQKIGEEKIYPNPIVTEIVPLPEYYPAESYHQDYYNNNTRQGYCAFVITPKVEKLKKIFAEKLSARYRNE